MSIIKIHKIQLDETTGCQELLGQVETTDLSAGVLALFVDEKAAVSGSDTTPSYLSTKLVAGDGIDLDINDPTGNEKLEINSLGMIKVSSNDSTIGYIEDKLTVGDYLTITTKNDGSDETVELDMNPDKFTGLHLGWNDEVKATFAHSADETSIDVDVENLDPVTGKIKNIVYRPDTSGAGALGYIQSIGKAGAMGTTEWAAVHGLLVEIVCEDNNWFNIKNNATIADTDFRKVKTVSNIDELFLSRALFSYDNVNECWYVIATTPASWQKTFTIASQSASDNAVDVVVADNLPQRGYYHFDVYVGTEEMESGAAANTAASQTLTVYTTDDTKTVDTSPTYSPSGTSDAKMINHSLQGSGIIYCNDSTEAAREVSITVSLPNGTSQSITGGYICLMYLGKMITT